jgi:methylated-DNA-[protein]-cysteine S-methyltransferase
MVASPSADDAVPVLRIDRVESPLGIILLVADGKALRALWFGDDEEGLRQHLLRHDRSARLVPTSDPAGLGTRLRAYLAGDLGAFEETPIHAPGTPFQTAVWAALREIPPGRTTTYGQLAARLGRPGSTRAVGLANGANPVAIAVPCHRVIGADGTLTGYGGGLWRKRWLLEHERAFIPVRSAQGDLFAHAEPDDLA